MPEDLTVHVNRRQRHQIEVAGGPLETDGSFEVVLRNHGAGSHVHLGLDGDLAAVATVEEPTPFLDSEATRCVGVSVASPRPVAGALTITTGYGQTSIEVPVSIVQSDGPTVDARPTASGSASVLERLPTLDVLDVADDPATMGLAALGSGAIFVALLAAWLVDSSVVLAAVFAVVVAVAGAVGLLLRE